VWGRRLAMKKMVTSNAMGQWAKRGINIWKISSPFQQGLTEDDLPTMTFFVIISDQPNSPRNKHSFVPPLGGAMKHPDQPEDFVQEEADSFMVLPWTERFATKPDSRSRSPSAACGR
jgi:hypothetical protein